MYVFFNIFLTPKKYLKNKKFSVLRNSNNLKIDNLIFKNNYAETVGAGIFCYFSNKIIITNCFFLDKAIIYGGAMYIYSLNVILKLFFY